jgi:hypothetical protein
VDPGATCGDDDNASTRGLRIETSSNGTTFTTVANTTFSAAQAHQLVNVTPTSKPKKVRVLRVTMLSNLNPNAGSGQNFMDLSEVAIYGKPSDLIKPVISNVSIPTGQTIRSMSGAAGFKIRAKLSEAGTMKGALTIPSTKARQLGIPAQIGTGTLGFLKAGLKTMTMRLTRRAKSAIASQPRLAVTAKLTATDRSANKATPVQMSVTLPHG